MIKTRKIEIMGAGHVGSHAALLLAVRGIADEIVFYDIKQEKAAAEAMDIRDAVSYFPHHVDVYDGSMEDMKDADILINAAGKRAFPWQTRLDLLEESVRTCQDLVPRIAASGFDGIIISISNPCDIIAAYLQNRLGWPAQKIIGSGTALDSARLQMQLSEQLHISRRSLTAYLLGEHGDSSMIPWSHVTAAGKPVLELVRENPEVYQMDPPDVILEKVHQGGYTENADKGCTEFGVASAVCEIICAILHDEHKILPCSVKLDRHYGGPSCFASVPARLGACGIEDIPEISLTKSESVSFQKSIQVILKHFQWALSL